jgi:hypothetical protein
MGGSGDRRQASDRQDTRLVSRLGFCTPPRQSWTRDHRRKKVEGTRRQSQALQLPDMVE